MVAELLYPVTSRDAYYRLGLVYEWDKNLVMRKNSIELEGSHYDLLENEATWNNSINSWEIKLFNVFFWIG